MQLATEFPGVAALYDCGQLQLAVMNKSEDGSSTTKKANVTEPGYQA